MPNPRPFIRPGWRGVKSIAEHFASDKAGYGVNPNLAEVLAKLPPLEANLVRLYRVNSREKGWENMSGHPTREFVGQWFTNKPIAAQFYLGNRDKPELVYLDVRREIARAFQVQLNPVAKQFSADSGEYIIPRELLDQAQRVRLDIPPLPMPGAPRPFLNE